MAHRRRELDDLTLARAQRGDAAAFRALVVAHQQLVFAYLWRMLGRRAERALCEDLTQDTFLAVHRGLPRFSPHGPARLSTWILTIATRLAINWLRRPSGPPPADQATVSGSAETTLIVRDALDKLTPDHRAVLLLREIHGLDYQEIATALELDLGTVKSRLSRAREALRQVLS